MFWRRVFLIFAASLLPALPSRAQDQAVDDCMLGYDHDRAIAACTELLALGTTELLGRGPRYLAPLSAAAVHTYRGSAYANKREYDRAIADFTEAIRLSPDAYKLDSGYVYEKRGKAYHAKREYDRAIADYSEAIRLTAIRFPDADLLPSTYYARGEAYRAKREYDRAIADYSEESWPRKFEQNDKWIFCLTAARILAANQERR